MKREVQLKLLEMFQRKMSDLITRKGDDYANEDRLSSFKESAAMINDEPINSCIQLMATKVTRLKNLHDSDEINFESIEDSLIDLANYAFLAYCISMENSEGFDKAVELLSMHNKWEKEALLNVKGKNLKFDPKGYSIDDSDDY